MKNDVGVPLAGGLLPFARERASATPIRRAADRSSVEGLVSELPAHLSDVRPVRVSLRALQEWFAGAVMHPAGVAASVRERGDLGGEAIGVADVERVVSASSRLSGFERIEIYHGAYRARLVECLADDYPALAYALGESSFESLCHAYIAAHPSRSPSLNAFGRHMSAFCRSRTDRLSAFGADLAALEWALVEVIHTAPADRLSEEALSKIPPSDWPRARFAPSDAVRVLEFGHAANAYFQAYNAGGGPDPPEPAWSATAVFREGPTIWRMDLSRAMHTLLHALFAGATIGAALDALASSGDLTEKEAPLLMNWFRDWVRYGFFASIAVETGVRSSSSA